LPGGMDDGKWSKKGQKIHTKVDEAD
jgi:hypothetical protein